MIRLWQNYWNITVATRQLDILTVLQCNNSNSYIDELVILTECPLDLPGARIIPVTRQPTFADFFQRCNGLTGPDDINIIANSDIAFDDTIKLVQALPIGACYAIVRQDILAQRAYACDSQDCWIFRGHIAPIVADYELGRPGCDNRLLYELEVAGYLVSNPGLSVRLHHLHTNPTGEYGEPVPGPIGWVTPGYL